MHAENMHANERPVHKTYIHLYFMHIQYIPSISVKIRPEIRSERKHAYAFLQIFLGGLDSAGSFVGTLYVQQGYPAGSKSALRSFLCSAPFYSPSSALVNTVWYTLIQRVLL